MALALLLLFASLGHIAQRLSAILAGVGFGTFIDELGKFITSDNDYFFQPTIGLIYIIFISIFLLLRALRGRKSVGSEVALANALNRLELAAGGGLDSETKSEIIELLEMSDRRNPLARTLRTYVEDVEIRRGADMGFYFKIRDWLLEAYSRIALSRWFVRVLIIAAALFAVGQLIGTGLLLAVNLLPTQGLELGFTGWAQTASATVAAMITAIGIWRLPGVSAERVCVVSTVAASEYLRYPGVRVLRVGACGCGRAVPRYTYLCRAWLYDRTGAG